MGEFRRTRSKIWWSNYFHDEDEADEATSSTSTNSVSRLSWRRSLKTDKSNNRNSSSSPSSGSHKSQDSGFSDSESSSPSSCSSKDSQNTSTLTKREQMDDTESADSDNTGSASTEITAILRLPETPISKIPRSSLIRHGIQETAAAKAEGNEEKFEVQQSKYGSSISSYLADCYFPVTSFVDVGNASSMSTPLSANKLPAPCKSAPSVEEQIYLQTVLNNSKTLHCEPSSVNCNSCRSESRTCFIVDELPKKSLSEGTSKDSKLLGNSFETSGSSADECKDDDTVRYVDRKGKSFGTEGQAEEATEVPPCINVDLLKNLDPNESRISNLDLTHLPEPTHTSTPKKNEVKEVKQLSRLAKKCKKLNDIPAENEQDRSVDAPVFQWLHEIKYRCEAECMITLQAKPVIHCCKQRSVVLVSEATMSILTLQQKTKKIANTFLKVYDVINDCNNESCESQLQKLIKYIMDFIMNYSQLLPRMESVGKENLLKLMDMCDRLRQTLCLFTAAPCSLLNDVCVLENFFSRFVDSVLTQQIVLIAAILERPDSECALLNALSEIVSLTSNTSQMYELIVRFNGIESLLAICERSNSASVRKAALRALSIVCNDASSIRRFERANGIEILSLLLSDATRTEIELLEVVSVLVQITAPWIENDHVIEGLVYYFHPIINALTRLIENTNSCETLLLLAAALANISFIDAQAVFILLELNTVSSLLIAVRKLGARATIFLQEQVATLIANLSAVTETRSYLAQHRAVGALLCFLQVKHSPIQSTAEHAAAERLQHKSAIALSRLCTNAKICKQVVELQGVSLLVRLCKEERERNFSDDILVACLASLRKITTNCGNESIKNLNAKELVEPRLVHSFLLYSSRQESYV